MGGGGRRQSLPSYHFMLTVCVYSSPNWLRKTTVTTLVPGDGLARKRCKVRHCDLSAFIVWLCHVSSSSVNCYMMRRRVPSYAADGVSKFPEGTTYSPLLHCGCHCLLIECLGIGRDDAYLCKFSLDKQNFAKCH